MGQASDAARDAIFKAIAEIAEEASKNTVPLGAAGLRDLAYAYRALVGGTQPGSVTVQK